VENTRKVFKRKWRICHIRVICGAQNCLQICGRYSNRFGEIQRKNLSVYGEEEKRLLTYSPNLPRDKRKSVYISVLIHLNQHFMERGLCRSERERTLEIIDSGHIIRWLSPSILFALIRTPGVTCCYLPLLQTVFRARKQTESASGGNILLIRPWDSGERAVSARLTGDLLSPGDTGDQHQQQEPRAHQQGLGEVSKWWTLLS
jgi:hypothetical protein